MAANKTSIDGSHSGRSAGALKNLVEQSLPYFSRIINLWITRFYPEKAHCETQAAERRRSLYAVLCGVASLPTKTHFKILHVPQITILSA